MGLDTHLCSLRGEQQRLFEIPHRLSDQYVIEGSQFLHSRDSKVHLALDARQVETDESLQGFQHFPKWF